MGDHLRRNSTSWLRNKRSGSVKRGSFGWRGFGEKEKWFWEVVGDVIVPVADQRGSGRES
ncbi:hypothetical protein FCV25MIE_20160, partial [Fagus crenata]